VKNDSYIHFSKIKKVDKKENINSRIPLLVFSKTLTSVLMIVAQVGSMKVFVLAK
jgi:hypothetical protein